MKRLALLIALVFLGGSIGYAAVIGVAGTCVLGNGPTACGTTINDPNPASGSLGGSLDWANQVYSNLGILATNINTAVNFNSPTPLGTLASNYYSLLGVPISIATTGIFTYNASSGVGGVSDDTGGPGDAGNTNQNPGEGKNTMAGETIGAGQTIGGVSNFAGFTVGGQFLGPNVPYNTTLPSAAGTITFSFTTPVQAFGLYVIDLYNTGGVNPDTLVAYSGQNGTGSVVATLTAISANFQQNDLYWMGLINAGGIGSVVFTNSPTGYQDYVAVDSVRFAGAIAPEPSSLALVFGGLALLALRLRKKPAR